MMIKRLSFAMAVLSAFAIISCTPEEEVAPASVSIDPTSLIFEYDADATDAASQTISLTATRDWTATVSGEGVTVTPSSGSGSNDPQTITITADKNEDKTKTATVTFSIGSTQTATLNVTIYGPNGDNLTFSDIYNAAEGTEVTTSGLVVAVNGKGFIMQDDEEEYLLVFGGNEATEPGAAIGDVVTVKGTTAKYGDLMQLTSPEISKTGTDDVTYGTPTVITSENIADISLTRITYLQMSGLYSTSTSSEGDTYHNIAISGTDMQGSIQYPMDDLGLADLVGHNITVTGFFAGGNNANYRNIMAVDVEDDGEAQIELSTIAEVLAASIGTQVKTDGTVMAICKSGYVIADESESAIYVYTSSTPKVAIGNTVTVSGRRAEYSGCQQIGNPTTTIDNSSTGTPAYPTAKVLTATELDNYTVTTAEYVEVSGTLSGTRINVSGATRTVSLSYPTDDLNHSAMNGLNVTLRGYVSNLHTGDNSETLYVIATSLEAEPYVNANNVGVGASATSATIEVESNTDWTVSKTSGDWATLGTTEGNGNGSINVTFDANTGENERTAEFTISYGTDKSINVTLTQLGTAARSYVKVTSEPSDWSGRYLIVCESTEQVFTGRISTTSTKYGLYESVTITETGISQNSSVSGYEVTIAKDGNYYTMNCEAGYLGWTSGNSLNAANSVTSDNYRWSISLADGILNAADNKRKLQFNANTSQYRFACYTSNQAAVTLFKLTE